jgi:Kef-type K+ transport system membrane component KefB
MVSQVIPHSDQQEGFAKDYMPDSTVVCFYQQLAILAIGAHLFGELARRLGLPAVIGQLLVGIMLGPTILKRLWPGAFLYLAPNGVAHPHLLAISHLAAALLLLASGMEVDLKLMRKHFRLSFLVSMAGFSLPFLLGFLPAFFWKDIIDSQSTANSLIFALFVGACFSLSALAVLAQMLEDFQLYKTSFGMMIMTAAITNDFTSWILLGCLVGMVNHSHTSASFWPELTLIMVGLLVLATFILPQGRFLCNRLMKGIDRVSTTAGGAIGFIVGLGLLGASLTQAMGLGPLLGAFVAGALIGSCELKQDTRQSIKQFVSHFLAPVYFSFIGLSVDFIANFSWSAVLIVFVLASIGKVGGCFWAARAQKISAPVALATGFAMNSRGGMSIIIATMGLQAGVLDEKMFVALTVLAVVSDVIAGRMLQPVAELLRREDCLAAEVV